MKTAVLMALLMSTAASADELPSDVSAYIQLREACNYWPYEHWDKSKLRRAEIRRHLRNLHCDRAAHDKAVLQARYRKEQAVLEAIDDAQDALPAN
jgi:tRNA(Ile)-lysidine synthase TilS/MesJ